MSVCFPYGKFLKIATILLLKYLQNDASEKTLCFDHHPSIHVLHVVIALGFE